MMKNLIQMICVIFALSLTSQVIAQSASIGLRGGVNISTLNSNPLGTAPVDLDQIWATGLNVAAFTKVNFGGVFSLQPEIQFIQKGVKYVNKTGSTDVKLTEKYNYLEVPVLANLGFGEGPVKINVFAGPSAGFAMTGKVKGENIRMFSEMVLTPGNFEEKVDWDNEFGTDGIKDNRLDFGGVAGLGLEIDLDAFIVVLDGRFNMDFTDSVVYENKPSPEPDKYFNRGIAATAGIAIPLGK